jgi:predicted transcriptional regulator
VANDDVAMILKELREIRKELEYIKSHMLDIDSILTTEEIAILKEAEKEFKEGKAIKSNDVLCG